ncbi:YusW family protein [Lentibacillus salicampi]|uniref:YusW-like protein n=1 Tax=Lentibacillus salicampi TaxID=175306 RepID=A0A4Y9AHF6_9BACI|nr:YusW family protein [Lentibacillus salicampi]TFJ94390.1 hypothetical protein E4U82_00285 [Lentibacillus salicampi]
MRKTLIAMFISLAALALTACGGGDDENTSENKEQTDEAVKSEQVINMTQDDMLKKMKELDYAGIDLDVLYSEKEFEGQIKEDDGLIEAEFYDPVNGMDERGAAAFDALFPIFQDMKIDKDMTDEDAVATALESFDIPDDFLKAELTVIFQDGTEKIFEVKKNEM